MNEYVQQHPLHIPFRDVLFGDPDNGRATGGPLHRRPVFGERMRTVKTTNWARYSGTVICLHCSYNFCFLSLTIGNSSNNKPSRILVADENGTPATEEVACASSVFDNAYEVPKRKGKKRGRPAKTPVPRPDSDEDDSDASSTCSYDFMLLNVATTLVLQSTGNWLASGLQIQMRM